MYPIYSLITTPLFAFQSPCSPSSAPPTLNPKPDLILSPMDICTSRELGGSLHLVNLSGNRGYGYGLYDEGLGTVAPGKTLLQLDLPGACARYRHDFTLQHTKGIPKP